MLLRNQGLDVALKLIVLAVLSVMLALPLRNLSYAFTPSEPLVVDQPSHLVGLATDRYVATTGTPRADGVLPFFRYGIHYYYFPLAEGGGTVYGRTPTPPRPDAPLRLAGRLQRFDAVPFANLVRQAYADSLGATVPDEAWIVLQDESPSAYRLVVYAYAPLALLWLACLYLLLRGLRHQPPFPWQKRRV
ncbi:MAG: hypothetical protein ACYC4L_17830 [Chloroflexota bacterium]